MTAHMMSREQVEAEIERILGELGLCWAELEERKHAASLTPEEWDAWDRVDNLRYLLD